MNITIIKEKKILVKEGCYGDMTLHEHYCPGCDRIHQIAVNQPFRNGAQWTFNGDFDNPTFSPSILIGPKTEQQCHYFIKNGKIEFCGDCNHDLKGQTVDLPEIPEEWL